MKNPLTKERVMTPTCFGIIAILAASFLWLRKHPWRPYLELVLFFWGVTIGFGGLGIALWNHAVESGRPWGWAALVSHWPSGDTLEQVFWHGWPAAVATAVAGHWWWRASRWHGKHTVNNSTGGKGT